MEGDYIKSDEGIEILILNYLKYLMDLQKVSCCIQDKFLHIFLKL